MEARPAKVIPITHNRLSGRSLLIWRIVQTIVWLAGLFIFFNLLFNPALGLLLFWNVLIPVAPALLVLATGLWRNICPLATTQLLPRHFNLSLKKKMSVSLQAKLQLTSVLLLFLLVPLRHAIFNTDGLATAILLIVLSTVGVTMGFVFDWKSGWCSTLCPIHPVERLYGSAAIFSFPNAHCENCVNCSIPCPDSTPNFHPGLSKKTSWHSWSGWLIAGGLPGFVWAWFHVPDQHGISSIGEIITIYQVPFLGLVVSLFLFNLVKTVFPKIQEKKLILFFAAAAVSIYYWYRIPALLGFGNYGKDGVLVNLVGLIPEWSLIIITICTTFFFFWWLLIRKPAANSWLLRPAYLMSPVASKKSS